jgi:hypothetical protein
MIKYLTRATLVPSKAPWPKVLNDLLTTALLWAVCYFFEKLMITYMSIHYHYRSDGKRIEVQKKMRAALNTLYEASTSLFAPFDQGFENEDNIIAGQVKNKLQLLKSKKTSRIVDKALEDPRSAAALAKRIWLSLVPQGHDVLTVDHIVEVIKSHRRAEAEQCFNAIDINQNGDLTLNEMVLTVMEMARARRAIFQGMMDIDRALNTLDWILCVILAAVMGAFISKFLLRFCSLLLTRACSVTLCQIHEGIKRCYGCLTDWSELWLWSCHLRILKWMHLHFPQTRIRRWRPN